MLVLCILFVTK